jgi:phytoene dehydrogenase-like protein
MKRVDVVLLERNRRVGGACVSETVTVDGRSYEHPLGATVLGLMQDFVFEETGLRGRLPVWAPEHPKIVHFEAEGVGSEPRLLRRDPARLDEELRRRCGERGDVSRFRAAEGRVVSFLREGFREATPPCLDRARARLGNELTERFILGSAAVSSTSTSPPTGRSSTCR